VTATLEHQSKTARSPSNSKPRIYARWIFDEPSKMEAERVYARYQKVGAPSVKEYKGFARIICFGYIAHEAGRLEWPLHIHVLDNFGIIIAPANSNVRVARSL